MTAPKYRTDSQACSCPGFWYRRTCKHYRAYREAMTLVEAQDAVNVTWWDTARGASGAVRGSQGSVATTDTCNVCRCRSITHTGQVVRFGSRRIKGVDTGSPIPANIATIGQSPIDTNLTPIGDWGESPIVAMLSGMAYMK